MRVSVICPVFDTAPALLVAAAHSVLDEPSGAVKELILSDDGSRDRATLDALDRLGANPRVRVLRGTNGGPARARNRALAAASGDWVGFIDADDLWLPDHLTKARAVLDAVPDAAWISANHDRLDPDGARVPSASFSKAHRGERVLDGVFRYEPLASTRTLIGDYWLHLGGCVVRTDVARRASGFDERALYSEDWLFFLCLSTRAPLHYVEQSTYVLRREHASFTTSSRRLTGARASGKRAAMTKPELRPYRRPLRWALRSTYKELAANNLLSGRPLSAVWFATRALLLDPRAAGDLARFTRAAVAPGAAQRRTVLARYSSAELISGARPGPAG